MDSKQSIRISNPHFTLVQQWIPNNLSESQNPHFTLVQQWIPQKKPFIPN